MDKTAEISANAEMFVDEIAKRIKELGLKNVFNSDQSGFTLEMCNGRTLAYRGVKSVSSVVQSVSSTTHSYTIMPTISADGDLLSPLLIVLKENNGVFGTRVKDNLFSHQNIKVLCSKSGKMGNFHIKKWIEEVTAPNLSENENLFLLDSFSGHIRMGLPPKMEIQAIPAGATGLCQPLDVYGFRVWKAFMRRFANSLRTMHTGVELRHRNCILKMHQIISN